MWSDSSTSFFRGFGGPIKSHFDRSKLSRLLCLANFSPKYFVSKSFTLFINGPNGPYLKFVSVSVFVLVYGMCVVYMGLGCLSFHHLSNGIYFSSEHKKKEKKRNISVYVCKETVKKFHIIGNRLQIKRKMSEKWIKMEKR